MAVLGMAGVRNIEFCNNLDTGYHCRFQFLWNAENIVEYAVDPVTNPHFGLLGIQVDIGGS
jgi:hypothetical protein